MAKFGEGGELLKCSFCGKSQKQVKKLIAGPGVYICDECIDLCNEIIEEELAENSEVSLGELPSPREKLLISCFLSRPAWLQLAMSWHWMTIWLAMGLLEKITSAFSNQGTFPVMGNSMMR